MAVWTFSRTITDGIEFLSSSIYDGFEQLDVLSRSSTQLRLQDPEFRDIFTFSGTGLTYSLSGGTLSVTGGTLTGLTASFNGQVFATWTGISIPAATMSTYVRTDNWTALNTLLFNTSDTYNLTDGRDEVRGFGGNDRMNGFGGDDSLLGDTGNDTLYGGLGNDTLIGGSGNDSLRGEAGNDRLLGDTGNDALLGGLGNDTLIGGSGNDILRGEAGNDSLVGDSGNDKLFGDSGADRLLGGLGLDTLIGGLGVDTMTGGAGADVFAFNHALAADREIITDFNRLEDDLHFDNDAFTAFSYTGQLRASGFVLGTAATDTADRFIYQQSTGNLWYDRDGSGAAVKVLVAELADGTALSAADIFIL